MSSLQYKDLQFIKINNGNFSTLIPISSISYIEQIRDDTTNEVYYTIHVGSKIFKVNHLSVEYDALGKLFIDPNKRD